LKTTLKFINGCKANNVIYKTVTLFLTANSYRVIIIVVLFIYTIHSRVLKCEFLPNLNGSPYLELFKIHSKAYDSYAA